jgi:hypothetical protein
MKFPLILAAATLTAFAADAPAPTPESVAKNYSKTLKRLTGKPKSINADQATLCSSTPEDRKFGPHNRHFVHFYRNEAAMTAKGDFPPGSVLVKEKFMSGTKGGEDMLPYGATGMIKQPKGAAPKSGDWQFFEIVEGQVVTAKMEGCAGCHSGAKRDYVFSDVPKR